MRHYNRFNREDWHKRLTPEEWEKHAARHRRGRVGFGILVALAGIFWLLRTFHALPAYIVDSDYTGGIVCLAIGMWIGFRSGFRKNIWWILCLIGIANLIPEWNITPSVSTGDIFPPLMIIVGGLVIALRSRRWKQQSDYLFMGGKFAPAVENTNTNEGSLLDIDILFAGKKEIVTSKDFRGGRVQATFGGVELNLMQADGDVQPMILDCKIAFGGLEIITPSHWQVINEIHPTFGNAEDKRNIRTPGDGEAPKTLIVRGSCTFGGIEIKSY